VEIWAQALRLAYVLREPSVKPVALGPVVRLGQQLAYLRADFRQAWREQPFGMALLTGIPLAALAASLFWPDPAFEAGDPATWPIDRQTAVVVHRSLLEDCPSSAWRLTRRWRLMSSGPEGIECVRSYWDLGSIRRIGEGVGRSRSSAALMLKLTPKARACAAGTDYESADYCLQRTEPPAGTRSAAPGRATDEVT
jgi:hypothetical protein